MRLWSPFLLETVRDAPVQAIDTSAIDQAHNEALEAMAEAQGAAKKAFEFEKDARAARDRVHARNREIDRKLFGKPPGWRKLDRGVKYIGFMTRDSDGDLVPHGDGETWFPSGNYLCCESHMQHPKGLTYWRFADGAERAGWWDERRKTGMCVDRNPNGVITAGGYAPGGMGITQTLGLIQYSDNSQYWGYCDYSKDADYWVPSGFGVWANGPSFACLGYFENGLLSGECALKSNVVIGGKASLGRLIAKSAEFRA
jgi:hypothetical protein